MHWLRPSGTQAERLLMRNLLFGLLLLFLSPLLRAQTPAVITFDQGQITVLRDKTKQLTLEQARSAHAEGQFRPLKGNLGLGFVPDAAWLHLSIDPDHPSARWLEVIPPYLDDIRLFHIGPDGRIDERRSGDRLPQTAKEEPYRGHLFKLDLQPGRHDIFIRLQTTSTLTAIVKLWQPRAFEQHLRSSYFGFGLYFSLILTVLLFNTANWLVSRRSIFLVYIGYLLVNCMQWLGTTGFVAEFLLPEQPGLANLAQGLLISAGAAMGWLFFMRILEIKQYHPFLYRFSQFGIAVSLVTFVATLVGHYQFFMAILLLTGAVSLCTVPWPMWRLWKTAETWARLLALAYLLYAALLLLNVLSILAILPFTEWSIQSGMASNIAHILFLHFALLLHLRRIEADHAAALEKSALAERLLSMEHEHSVELEKLSRTDPLTTLANRRHFDEVLENEFRRMSRTKGTLSVIMIDIDYFKSFNDTYGHQKGDECLQVVAGAIKAAMRRPQDLAARYGGEEFICLLPETSQEGAIAMAVGIKNNIAALQFPHTGSQVAVHVTVSLGVATVVCDASMLPEHIIKMADDQLYWAKNNGRNRVGHEAIHRT